MPSCPLRPHRHRISVIAKRLGSLHRPSHAAAHCHVGGASATKHTFSCRTLDHTNGVNLPLTQVCSVPCVPYVIENSLCLAWKIHYATTTFQEATLRYVSGQLFASRKPHVFDYFVEQNTERTPPKRACRNRCQHPSSRRCSMCTTCLFRMEEWFSRCHVLVDDSFAAPHNG